MNILAQQYYDSGIMSTDVPDEDTDIDWLDYFSQNSHNVNPKAALRCIADLILL